MDTGLKYLQTENKFMLAYTALESMMGKGGLLTRKDQKFTKAIF